MPLDLNCPKCQHVFPVTEARHPIGVECPRCDAELTAEFLKLSAPEPGQPPYELLVTAGHPNGVPLPLPGKKLRTDEEKEERGGSGSMAVVVVAGLGALLVALGGLGATGYFLFTNLDTSDSTIGTINSNKANNKGNTPPPRIGQRTDPDPGIINPGQPFVPPKNERPKFEPRIKGPQFETPKTEFILRTVGGVRQNLTPPPLDLSSPVTLDLPGKAEAAAVGGNGRYLVFHIQSKQQLTVFDASKGAFVATVNIPDSGPLKLAGGQNRLVTCDFAGRILRSYTLPELKHEFDFTSPLFHSVSSIAMGSAVNSPLLVSDPFAHVALMELTNSEAKLVEGSKTEEPFDVEIHPFNAIAAAPNGRLFAFSRGLDQNEKTGVLTEQGRKWKAKVVDVSAPSISVDGRYLFGKGAIADLNGAVTSRPRGGQPIWYVAGLSGRHFLRLLETREDGKQLVSITVHLNAMTVERDKNPASLGVLPETEGLIDSLRGNPLPLDKHLFFIPDAKLLVVLPASNDKIVLRKVELR